MTLGDLLGMVNDPYLPQDELQGMRVLRDTEQ